MWMKHPEYAEVMEKFWNESEDGRARWSEKLRECKRMLKNWNKGSFGNVEKRINKLKKELDDIKKLERTVEVIEKENEITEELDLWFAMEETLWMQRSRVLWLKQSDKNTSFFHAKASHRQKKNWISKLRDANGVMQEDQGKVMEIVTDYFRDMFRSALRVEDSVLQGDAVRIEDWRPISLCTVAVKIITKLIAMRLQPILQQVISIFQSAFVKGRIISDNFVIAHEIANYLKSRRGPTECFASIKLDMSKAYDRVEWLFLEKLLRNMGFASLWVDRVMCCVCSVSYQIRINDTVSSIIRPERGLRLGDPLSPYLFLLCTKLLNAKMCAGMAANAISGVRICRNAPTVTHLFFADDSIFFIKAEAGEARSLKAILSQYECVTGQRINYEKSEIVFSRNTPVDVRVDI
ncbi:hypothetical protein QQ045_023138 [Rhodiola kirilowii]